MKHLDLAGLLYVGEVSHPNVNQGASVPHYEPMVPENHPGINTLEGWNAAAAKANRRAFTQALGREPKTDAELNAWVDCMCNGE